MKAYQVRVGSYITIGRQRKYVSAVAHHRHKNVIFNFWARPAIGTVWMRVGDDRQILVFDCEADV